MQAYGKVEPWLPSFKLLGGSILEEMGLHFLITSLEGHLLLCVNYRSKKIASRCKERFLLLLTGRQMDGSFTCPAYLHVQGKSERKPMCGHTDKLEFYSLRTGVGGRFLTSTPAFPFPFVS